MRWLKIIALVLFLAAGTAVGIFIYQLSPVSASSADQVDFKVVSGQSSKEIADTLKSQNLIKNSYLFYIYLKATKSNTLPGLYKLSPSMSASDIADLIASGKFETVTITIPEGWRASQIANYVAEKGLSDVKDFKTEGEKNEGYLFPDTYNVKKDITTDELIKLMKDNFDTKTKDLKITPETVILASIVEREAQNDEERSQIAGVYTNRMNKGMLLQADPTIQYAKGDWTAPTLEEYHSVISPYNTYLNPGLPPGPICNPGLASIKAALNPDKSDYLFFFHAKGQIFLSKTAAEHEAKVAQEF